MTNDLLANFQAIAAITIAANLAYLNIQNLKFFERSKELIRSRVRYFHNSKIDPLNGYHTFPEYSRLYWFGELMTSEFRMESPGESTRNSSLSHRIFEILFMNPLRNQFPVTADKMICALTLTFSVLLFLMVNFSFATGLNLFSTKLGYDDFYTIYVIGFWFVPFAAIAASIGFFIYDYKKKKDKNGDKLIRKLLFIGVLIVLIFLLYNPLRDVLGLIRSVSDFWMATWIYVLGGLLFIPTYLVVFAALVFPGFERQLEEDVARLYPRTSEDDPDSLGETANESSD